MASGMLSHGASEIWQTHAKTEELIALRLMSASELTVQIQVYGRCGVK
jgi:hypothetical protein